MKVTVVGTGYVGLVTGVSLAELGHRVVCVGRDKDKIDKINSGISPFYEPGLNMLIKKSLDKKLLLATDDLTSHIIDSDAIVIAVGTPTIDEKIDLTQIENASSQIGKGMKLSRKYQVVVVKSTVVPLSTESVVLPIIINTSNKKVGEFGICMNPEFLREGNAVEDALHPDRIVIGVSDKKSGEFIKKLYKKTTCPIIVTNLRTAELIKYTTNSLFATLISFSNEIARVSEKIGGVDVVDVWKAVHLDARLSPLINGMKISPGFLNYLFSGCGYGGSCFPKDTKALLHFAKKIKSHPKILQAVVDVNATQPQRMIALLKQELTSLTGKRIGVLGLTFKPNTDDLRESPALAIIELLKNEKAIIVAHDPQAYKKEVPNSLAALRIKLTNTPQEAIENADAVLLVTSWDDYRSIKPAVFKQSMKNPLIIDGRRIFNKEEFMRAGIVYKGIGFSGAK